MSNPLLDGDTPGKRSLTFQERLVNSIKDRFNLDEDAAYEGQTLENVRAAIKFRGANLWILMLAILICSIGLNVNSTAVIIGAMLISPLMGPILGIGCGAAISDFDLLVSAAKNLGIATLASVAVSALYFSVSPLHDAQSELLARTAPTLFDVLIATFGGLVGIIALSRREKSNAIPGVAIATALMPPVCTVGYSLATAQWYYLAGALYLYFINLTFIAFSTFLLVRFMRFSQHSFRDVIQEKRTKRWIYSTVALVAIPSCYTAYTTVKESVLEARVNRFVDSEFDLDGTQVIGKKMIGFQKSDGPKLTLMLIGNPLSESDIQLRKDRLREFALEGMELDILQSADLSSARMETEVLTKKHVDISTLYQQAQSQLDKKNQQIGALQARLASFELDSITLARLEAESRSLYPSIQNISLGHLNQRDTSGKRARWVVRVQTKEPLSSEDLTRYGEWIRVRQNLPAVTVVQQ